MASFQMDLATDDEKKQSDEHEKPREEKVETDGHHKTVGAGATIAAAFAGAPAAPVHQPHAEEKGDESSDAGQPQKHVPAKREKEKKNTNRNESLEAELLFLGART